MKNAAVIPANDPAMNRRTGGNGLKIKKKSNPQVFKCPHCYMKHYMKFVKKKKTRNRIYSSGLERLYKHRESENICHSASCINHVILVP